MTVRLPVPVMKPKPLDALKLPLRNVLVPNVSGPTVSNRALEKLRLIVAPLISVNVALLSIAVALSNSSTELVPETLTLPVPRLLATISRPPPVTEVVPVYVFAPDKVQVPVPALAREVLFVLD